LRRKLAGIGFNDLPRSPLPLYHPDMKTARLLSALSVLLTLTSCSAYQARLRLEKEQKALAAKAAETPPLFEWANPGPITKPVVKIDLGEQKARIYDNGEQVAWTYVATGTSNRPTPRGTFCISEKKVEKYSNRWGIIVDAEGNTVNWNACNGVSKIPPGGRFVGAPMPNWMRLTNGGIGMHAGPIPNPGSTASHGCIRLPAEMASLMYDALPPGTSVTIAE